MTLIDKYLRLLNNSENCYQIRENWPIWKNIGNIFLLMKNLGYILLKTNKKMLTTELEKKSTKINSQSRIFLLTYILLVNMKMNI